MQSITYDLKEDDILYFLHIPKTAGMSLVSILDNYFDYDSILLEIAWQELILTLPRDFSRYRLIRGHFGYSIHRILPKKPIFMTMLREPIERTISDYEHMKREALNFNLVEFFSKKNISDFLTDDSTSWRLTNNQIRHIGIDRDILAHADSIVKTGLGNIRPSMTIEYKSDGEPSDEELLEIAKQRLLEFPFFGITERFYDSMLLFAYTFGFRPNINLSKRNVTHNRTRRDDLPEDSIELLLNCTKLDRDLYAYGKDIFDSRFIKMVHDLEEKYTNHGIQNMSFQDRMLEMLQKNHEDRYCGIYGSDFIEYDFRQKVQGIGWEAREFAPDGTAFRWIGPETTASMYFALKRDKDKKLRFRIPYVITPDILENLKVKVDGKVVELEELLNYRDKRVFEVTIPKIEKQEERFTSVVFQVDHVVSPSSINLNSTDDRLLGIAIDWIKVL
ncbi:MAG: hypothetical protein WA799_00350 [Nitrosotalea sp.]